MPVPADPSHLLSSQALQSLLGPLTTGSASGLDASALIRTLATNGGLQSSPLSGASVFRPNPLGTGLGSASTQSGFPSSAGSLHPLQGSQAGGNLRPGLLPSASASLGNASLSNASQSLAADLASQGLPGWWGNMSSFPLGTSGAPSALTGNPFTSGAAGLGDLGLGTDGTDTFQSMLMPTGSQPPAAGSKDAAQPNGPDSASSPLPHGMVNMTAAELGIRDDDTDLQALLMPSEAAGSLPGPNGTAAAPSTSQHPSTHTAAAPASDADVPANAGDPLQPTDKAGASLTPEELKFYGEMFNQPGGVPSISLTSPIHAGSCKPISQPTGRNTLVPMSALSAEEIRMMDLVASTTPHNASSSGMGVSDVLTASVAPEAADGLSKPQSISAAGTGGHTAAEQNTSGVSNAQGSAAHHLNGLAATGPLTTQSDSPQEPSAAVHDVAAKKGIKSSAKTSLM